ncbi:MAG TPA: DUF420 domain-containing protein [Verrucomicrobiae bacterium]|nr:DUF420 domain-containing protein [Verrucomicrobiae bacterium]
MTAQDLPAINAALNAATAVLLVAGYVAIRRGNARLHMRLMSAAFGLSIAFLGCYLAHKFLVGPKRFPGHGWVRPVYFAVLLTHTVLAAVNLPLIFRALWLVWVGRFEAHRRLARWAWPIWMYVSVTGVAVYLMLYRMGF